MPPRASSTFLVLLMSTVASTFAAAAGTAQLHHVPASSPHFRYEGRFDAGDAAAPVVIWQGSRISIEFEGSELGLLFGEVKGQVFFDATIDGRTTRVDLREGQTPAGSTFRDLGAGPHSLVLFKRSEASAGTARFRGIEISPGSRVQPAPEPDYGSRMLFFGDSITAGANNEDGEVDQWEDRSTHNNALSYAALTAGAFNADYRNIAVSGMGVSEGYADFVAAQIWDRLYPSPDSPRAELRSWQPDIIFVNYGENDSSFTNLHQRPFPPSFARDYVALIQAIRTAWPKAQIVLLRGGMHGGARDANLREAWETAVGTLTKKDPKLSSFVFTHWTATHPRVADHRIMADELTAWLRQQPFAPASD